jgi:acetyl-CoA C-acetyltransferase
MKEVCIVAAKRTPQGKFLGALKDKSAVDLAFAAAEGALQNLDRAKIDQVIVGTVISAGQGMNIARQIGIRLGLPIQVPAFTVNMMCASGMKAVMLAAQAIRAGDASVVLCGGTESMSNAPYLLPRARMGLKLGDTTLQDALLRDGYIDTFNQEHMGVTAERLAQQYQISRAEQDDFAAKSQKRYKGARASGKFKDELVALNELECDEQPRPDTSIEKLASLKTVFKSDGTITAGNASGINDGAAMLVVSDRETAQKNNWPVLALIEAYTALGCDPKTMGMGPSYAVRLLCQRIGCELEKFDAIEINEAFAAQILANLKELNLSADRINIYGGAIALGHPVGASGARLIAHLAHRIARQESSRALGTLCVGGGMGVAMALKEP